MGGPSALTDSQALLHYLGLFGCAFRSTGGIPASSKLTPQQAAFYFLAGYDGSSFNPAFARSASAADPLKSSQALASLVRMRRRLGQILFGRTTRFAWRNEGVRSCRGLLAEVSA